MYHLTAWTTSHESPLVPQETGPAQNTPKGQTASTLPRGASEAAEQAAAAPSFPVGIC
jgi:hypothetical protein